MRMRSLIFTAACCLLMIPTAQASCGTASCSVNTGVETHGAEHEKNLVIDLRYEFIDQNRVRLGRKIVSGVPNSHNEIEQRTINRNGLLGIDYAFDTSWSVSTQLPVVSRSHTHLDSALQQQAWNFTEIGDARVVGRYQFARNPFETSAMGVNFGLKLPTGATNISDAAGGHHGAHSGTNAERILQPGTGSTDIVLGAFYNAPVGTESHWFIQGLWQKPVISFDSYTPGARYSLDVGMRYAASDRLSLLLQLNTLIRDRDQGANANPQDTGGTFVNISPGLRYALSPDLDIYGFLQQPIYQHVNGVQLTSDWSALAGVSQRF